MTMKRPAVIFAAAVALIFLSSVALPVSALAKRGSDDDGHVLVSLWKNVDRALGADRPQAAATALEKVIEKAGQQRLAWDFYDAWSQYADIMTARNWKLADSLSSEWLAQTEASGEPVAVYCVKYGRSYAADPDSALAYVAENAAVLKSSVNRGFYSGAVPAGRYRTLPGFVRNSISDDYEYVLWTLVCRLPYGSPEAAQAFSLLSSHIGDAYPRGAYLEYFMLMERSGNDGLEEALDAFIRRYSGRAISLYALQSTLELRFEELQRQVYDADRSMSWNELSDSFMALREDCSDFERLRNSFSGVEADVADECDAAESLARRLDASDISVSADGDSVDVVLRNLGEASLKIVPVGDGGIPVMDTVLFNTAGSYFIPDTVRVRFPQTDDGDYVISCRSGKEETSYSCSRRTISAAHRLNGDRYGIYATDYMTGKPLENAAVSLYSGDSLLACMNVGSFRGFEPFPYDMASLPDPVAARRMYYVCSYIDSAGNRRLSREIPLSPAVSGTLRKDSAGERVWNCAIYMDRAAFNPGDTVQFKGILYDAGGMNTAPEGKKVKVLLYGPQGERLDSSDAVTGRYGSFAGSFPLPAGGRNGRYVIAVEEQGRTVSRNSLTVDDFVLPTYSLTFDDAEGFVFPGGNVEVSGHVESYTGHSISSATVRYTVEKDFDVLVAEGVVPLDADGRFSFVFVADDSADGYDYYDVTVTVSDVTGESLGFGKSYFAYWGVDFSISVLDEPEGSMDIGYQRNYSGGHHGYGSSILDGEKARCVFSLKNTCSTEIRGENIRYSVMQRDSVLYSGETFSGDTLEIDLSGLRSGEYRIEAECPVSMVRADGRDTLLVARYSHILLKMNEGEDSLDADVENAFKVLDDNDIVLLAGAARGPVWAVVELWDEDGILLHSDLVTMSGERGRPGSLKTLRYEFKPEYTDKVLLRVFYFRNGRNWSFSHVYSRPDQCRELPLELVSSTGKAAPGEECHYEVRTSPGTEVLVSVFDKSTEQIAPNYWPLVSSGRDVVSVPVSAWNGYVKGMFSYRLGESAMTKNSIVADAMAAPVQENIASGTNMGAASGAEVVPRSDFSGTLAFLPFLEPDSDGVLHFSFRTSDKISTYVVSVLAHDRSMGNSVRRKELLVTKPVMVSVSAPAFLYQGDSYVMKVSVGNRSGACVYGMLTLYVYESAGYESSVPVMVVSRPVSVGKDTAMAEEFVIDVPAGVDTLGFKAVFSARNASHGDLVSGSDVSGDGVKSGSPVSASGQAMSLSDGVFVAVPVKPAYQTIIESHSAMLLPGTSRDSLYNELRKEFVNVSGYGSTAMEISLEDMLFEALPDTLVLRGSDVLSLSEALYSSCLAAFLKQGHGGGTVTVLDENGGRIGTAAELAGRLGDYVCSDGGLAWFPGMDSSPIITAAVLERIAGLRDRKVLDMNLLPESLVRKAVQYLDSSVFSDVSLPLWAGGISLSQYLYVRSMFADMPLAFPGKGKIPAETRRKIMACLDVKGENPLEGDILAKARRVAVIMNLSGADGVFASGLGLKRPVMKKLMRNIESDMTSLMEYAVEHPSGGVYFPNAVMPYRGLLESELYAHSLICDLLTRYADASRFQVASGAYRAGGRKALRASSTADRASWLADGLRIWIMVQKETQDWTSDPAFIDAVASVSDGLASVSDVSVLVLAQRVLKPFVEVAQAGNGFEVERKYYVERSSSNADVPAGGFSGDGSINDREQHRIVREEIKDGDSVFVGDKVTAVYRIWNAENRSFVRVTAPRNASLRPSAQLSGRMYGVLRTDSPLLSATYSRPAFLPQCYREVKADRTVYYFDSYPEETTYIEEQFIVNQAGIFTSPVLETECMYAPHYRANASYDGKMKID